MSTYWNLSVKEYLSKRKNSMLINDSYMKLEVIF